MLGRLVSMIAGRSIARTIGGAASGPAGAAIGVLLPTVLRRMGPQGMIVAALGGYVVKKAMKKYAVTKAV
ncbi:MULTISPECIES: hypothetical protein [Sphingosinicellaceae]|uniref:hypothetical protein n=1 Tax=Sphingosinicellaceae TaxID=2820280 RepID=UPI001C1E0290|nr:MULTISPECIES: hypothetical protein [Polymorphobacter]QYE36202.1 hypothetical protein KZX46_09850 [Polymorphobacter sp. PAMC 29334]UAJ10225.1 hypothetical protein KTC28_00140 [Polymorphobacter megasporae]